MNWQRFANSLVHQIQRLACEFADFGLSCNAMISNLKNLSLEELRACFNKYLLSAPNSISSASSDMIARALWFGLPLEVTGEKGPRYKRVLRLIQHLGIPYTEMEYTPHIMQGPVTWINEPSSNGLRLWVVDCKYGLDDLGLLLKFCFEYHSRFIRRREPDFALPQIDATYLVFLWWFLVSRGESMLSNKIFRDLVTMPRGHWLSVPSAGPHGNEDTKTVISILTGLQPTTQMFLGFFNGDLKEAKLAIDGAIKDHSINSRVRRMQLSEAFELMNGESKLSIPPWYIRRFHWPIANISTVAANAVYLSIYADTKFLKDKEQVDEWLMCRLRGMKDDDISQELRVAPADRYQEWLRQHRISTEPDSESSPLDEWLKACQILGLEPDPSDVGVQHVAWEKQQTAAPAPEQQPTHEIPVTAREKPDKHSGFRHSPDYRSVVAVGGKSFVLTSKQAEVIQALHYAYENGTPSVSQASLINDVYPGSKERKLKRLFRNDEAYDALIQRGSRRGVVRLRISDD